MNATEEAEKFIENSSKIFWHNIEHELELLSEKEGATNSLNQKKLRALLFLHYRIEKLEKPHLTTKKEFISD